MTFPLIDASGTDAGREPDDAGGPESAAGWPAGPAGWLVGPAGWLASTGGWLASTGGWLASTGGWPVGTGVRAGGQAGPVFVGRSGELDRMAVLLADAAAGRPRIVLVEGSAGLGKSSLVTEFLGRHRTVPVLAASGEASERALPWGLVRQLGHRADSGWLPAAPLLASGPAAGADPLAVGEELLGLFAARSAEGPLAVVIEDLQWADQPSARALLYACRRLVSDQVLVVVSGRPRHLGRLGEGWARFLTGDRRCSRLPLGGLSAAELTELAAALGCGGLSGRALRRVADHSRGNPMFARAMLTELPGSVLEGQEDGLHLPRSLAAAVLPKLASLPGDARNLVLAAAVLGQHPVPGQPLAAAAAAALAGVAQADNALDQAVTAGFLAAQPEQRGLRFSHELVRRAVYAEIGTARRRSLHRWAAAMTDGPAALRHRVAAASGTDLRLAADLDEAAAAAAGRGEPGAAAACLVQAADLGARGPQRAGRLLSAFELLVRAADAGAAEALRPAAEQLPASARRNAALGQLALLQARPAAAEALLSAAWSAYRRPAGAEEEGVTGTAAETRARAEAGAGLAWYYGTVLSLDECRAWTRRSMRAASSGGNAPAAVLATLAMARAMAGEAEAALAMFSDLPAPAALVPDGQADALAARGLLRLWTGDLARADDDLTAVVARISGGLRLRYPGQAVGYLAETAFRLGRWDEAQEHAVLAVSLAEEAGRTGDLPFAHNLAARIAALRGKWELAAAHVRSAEQAARAAGTGSAMVFAAAARAVLGFARDEPAEVLAGTVPASTGSASTVSASAGSASTVPASTVSASAGSASTGTVAQPPAAESCDDPTASLWRPLRIWALIRAGRLDDAAAALDRFEAGPARRGDRPAQVHAARLRASLALARGEPEQAERVLEAARAVAEGLPDPAARALYDTEYGRCLARAHRRPAALARLRSAHEALAGLGARPLADAVAAELAALGVRGGPGADCGLASLTAQEAQVARLVADGLSNREVAAQLYLSPKTIEYHLAHIFAKLGIKTRYQLAARIRPAAELCGPLRHGQPGPARPPRRQVPGQQRQDDPPPVNHQDFHGNAASGSESRYRELGQCDPGGGDAGRQQAG